MRKNQDSNTNPIDKTRRHFFRQFLSETICLFEEISGKPQMRLSELDQVSDDVVRKMIPVLNKSSPYRVEANRLLMKHKETELFEEIYRLESREMYIFRCFDGRHTLEDIAHLLEDRFKQDNKAAYLQVKNLFMVLAKRMICYPAHAHD